MKTYFKLELKKAIFSWRTIVSILILIALFMVPALQRTIFPYPGLDGVDSFIRLSEFSYIGYIAPVIAGLIYSTSIIRDKESGFMDKLMEIITVKTYFIVKLIVNIIISAFAFVISEGVVILYLFASYGISNGIKDAGLTGAFVKGSAFIGIYDISKLLYIIITFLVVIISSVAFSTFMLGITTASKKKLTAYILPIFYVILTGILFEIWLLNGPINFNITLLFNVVNNRATDGISVLVYDLILMLLGIGLIYRFGYKRTLNSKSNSN